MITMDKNDREKFGKMEAQIDNIKEDVDAIKTDIKEVLKKIDCLNTNYTDKFTNLDRKYSGKWVEKAIITVAGTVSAAIIVLLLQVI